MAGYGVMAAITLLTGVAAVLPGVQARVLVGVPLLAAGWWLYITRSRSRLRLADRRDAAQAPGFSHGDKPIRYHRALPAGVVEYRQHLEKPSVWRCAEESVGA